MQECEIALEDAIELVEANKSIFVWIGGWTNTPLADLLGIDHSKVIDKNPFSLIDRDSYPEELKMYEAPIFVCHHGVTSFQIVKELEKEGIKGYSLADGIEGIKSRHRPIS